MRVLRTPDFERALHKLPARTRSLCEKQLAILAADWRDPRLHLKKLRVPYEGIYSFRITRTYRGLFYFAIEDSIIVFDADHRKDVYR